MRYNYKHTLAKTSCWKLKKKLKRLNHEYSIMGGGPVRIYKLTIYNNIWASQNVFLISNQQIHGLQYALNSIFAKQYALFFHDIF